MSTQFQEPALITATNCVRPAMAASTLSLRWADATVAFNRDVDDQWLLVRAANKVTGEPKDINKPADPTVKMKVDRAAFDSCLVATVTEK